MNVSEYTKNITQRIERHVDLNKLWTYLYDTW